MVSSWDICDNGGNLRDHLLECLNIKTKGYDREGRGRPIQTMLETQYRQDKTK